ncbi:hypothetical protein EKO27_g2491 [Xylaria grammica]|uniref:F-box domain-containing protein n=1 Tax=Xylaria grammica TaxID=363999 RepID=A0A439DE06_9PEZI|nr:hypothetical protein EKO27_g2491 [Xylaria grammica]
MSDATADAMADKTTMDSLWQSPKQLMVLMRDQCRLLHPGQKPSEQQINHMYNICNSLDNTVDAVCNATWFEGPLALSSTDYEALFAHLSEIERLDVEWRWLRSETKSLMKSHEEHTRREGGCYPNESSLFLVKQLSLCLSRLVEPMDSCRFHLRHKINELARGTARPFNVLDFPDEMLMRIFHFVQYECDALSDESRFLSIYPDNPSNTCDIPNARLTCRRFCATSSHLLIGYVNLDLQTASLSRLQDISQHPTISKGIRGVTIHILPYSSELAESLQTFASVWAGQLGRYAGIIRSWQNNPDEPPPSNTGDSSSEPHTGRPTTLDKLSLVQRAWEEFANNTDGVPESNACVEVLRTYYPEYQRRYKDQQHLLESGFFVEATAIALAQMPLAQELLFKDIQYPSFDDIASLKEFADDPLAIGKTFLRPIPVPELRRYGLECKVPLDIIVTLLGALGGAGVVLKHVAIYSGSAYNAALLAPDPTAHRNLVLLAKRLKSICLLLKKPREDSDAQPELEGAYQFLSALMDTSSLETLVVFLSETLWRHSPDHLSFGPALNSRERKRLKYLALTGVSIHGDELTQMLSSFEPCYGTGASADPVLEIEFNSIRLLSGLWADGLEALHGRVTSNSTFTYPVGAECPFIPGDVFHRLFSTDPSEPSPVDRYIRDRRPETPNPMDGVIARY